MISKKAYCILLHLKNCTIWTKLNKDSLLTVRFLFAKIIINKLLIIIINTLLILHLTCTNVKNNSNLKLMVIIINYNIDKFILNKCFL